MFQDLNIQHINQTGCIDVIFTTTEVVSHYLHESEAVYLCCYIYNLQEAFDSVEYGIILYRLYDAGINAKPSPGDSFVHGITQGHGQGWWGALNMVTPFSLERGVMQTGLSAITTLPGHHGPIQT